MKYLIIGNGVAGIEAAFTIRQKDNDGDIVVVSSSKYPHYYRPKLIDYIKEDMPHEKLYIFKDEVYQSKKISTVFNTEIVSINSAEKFVLDSSGKRYEYGKLLLAVGSHPFIPEMENFGVAGCFCLRGIDDADRIKSFCRGKNHVVLLGGGLLGIETASALSAYCKKITVIDNTRCLLPKQLDDSGAKILQKFLEQKGLTFLFNDCVKQVTGKDSVKSVVLGSGMDLAADALIVSAGVRANVSLAKSAGIATGTGILINSQMQTSVSDVYASGDCAEFGLRTYGLWTVSKEQGHFAGLNMAGELTHYAGSIPSTQLKVTGIDLYSSGVYSSANAESISDTSEDRYVKLVYDGDTPIGAIVIGDASAVKIAQKVMTGKASLGEFKKIIKP